MYAAEGNAEGNTDISIYFVCFFVLLPAFPAIGKITGRFHVEREVVYRPWKRT